MTSTDERTAGRQTAVAVLRATWDTIVDDFDDDYDDADTWLHQLDAEALVAAVRFLVTATIAAAEGDPSFDRGRFLAMLGVQALSTQELSS